MELLKTPLERLIQERQLLTDLENEENSFKIQEWNSTNTNELHLNFSLKIGTIDFNGVLVYPELFPELPAYIRPQKSGERWSILHQYGGSGVLCLEYGPDNWNTNISGVELIRSARILLLTDAMTVLEMDVEPVPSRHSETIGQKLRGISERFIETPMLRHILLGSDPEKMDFKVAISSIRDKTVIVPTNIRQWLSDPIKINLSTSTSQYQDLNLDIRDFNGPDRAQKTSSDWNNLIKKAVSIGDFIHSSGDRRTLLIDGKQRMSTACMLGYVFSATRNFLLEIEHNGLAYRTDDHKQKEGQFFNKIAPVELQGETEAIVTIGFPTAIGKDIDSTINEVKSLPRLNLESSYAIDNMETLNLAVREAKSALVSFKSENKLSKLHLFIKAPSVFAMVLGHRLNGVCDIQLYDWVDGQYIPTAELSI